MPFRLASTISLLVFVICLIAGMGAGNSFGTTVSRALMGLVVTMGIGLIVGWMAQKMLEENLKFGSEKSADVPMKSEASDR